MSVARLTLVTSDAERALRDLLGVDRPPGWCAVAATPAAIDAIPDGARCLGLFSEPRETPSQAERAWRWRVMQGGTVGLTGEEFQQLVAWRARHGGGAARAGVAEGTGR